MLFPRFLKRSSLALWFAVVLVIAACSEQKIEAKPERVFARQPLSIVPNQDYQLLYEEPRQDVLLPKDDNDNTMIRLEWFSKADADNADFVRQNSQTLATALGLAHYPQQSTPLRIPEALAAQGWFNPHAKDRTELYLVYFETGWLRLTLFHLRQDQAAAIYTMLNSLRYEGSAHE